MCIGLPMRVIETGSGWAVCDWCGETRRVDTRLLDDPAPGDWLLVFVDRAVEVLSEERARLVIDALRAVELAARGVTDIDHLFPDLAGREPTLPAFLRPAAASKEH